MIAPIRHVKRRIEHWRHHKTSYCFVRLVACSALNFPAIGVGMIRIATVLLAVLIACGCSGAHADELSARERVQAGKNATAIVFADGRYRGTACCIDPEGWFVTTTSAVGNATGRKVSLVTHVENDDELITAATVVRTDSASRLALLFAGGKPHKNLALGDDSQLFETSSVTTFSYLFRSVAVRASNHPAITVHSAAITSLRKNSQRLTQLHLDKRMLRGSTGGAVVDETGKLVAVLHGAGIDSATPVSELRRLLATPLIRFKNASMDATDLNRKTQFSIEVVDLLEPLSDDVSVNVDLTIGDNVRSFETKKSNDSNYSFTTRLLQHDPTATRLEVNADFGGTLINGFVADRTISVGDDNVRLSDVSNIKFDDQPGVARVTTARAIYSGQISGLEKVKVNLGQIATTVELAAAKSIQIKRVATRMPQISYRVTLSDGSGTLAESSGELEIRNAPKADSVGGVHKSTAVAKADDKPSRATPSRIDFPAPELQRAKTEIKLPASIDDVAIGAAGRLLVLHIKKLQQLAVFDVSELKIKKFLPLPTNDVTVAASAVDLFIGDRQNKTLQRWNLKTLELEQSVEVADGIATIAISPQATEPLFLQATQRSNRSWIIDPNTMQRTAHQWQGWKGGAWGPVNVRVCFDGSTVVASGGGWAGIEVAAVHGGQITARRTGSYTRGDTLISGNGSFVFPEEGPIVREDLAGEVNEIAGRPFPALAPAIFLTAETIKGKATLNVIDSREPRHLATITDLPELEKKTKLPTHQRVMLIPQGRVLITVGEGSDSLIIRPFDLAALLAKSGRKFLFVESSPGNHASAGTDYQYVIDALSSGGNLEFSLQAGPDGMRLSEDGVVQWKVPNTFAADIATVIVKISDSSGQEIFHNFRISVDSGD